MKLKYIKNYLSIEEFNEIELNDFSVLTGFNGSGKTHLLKGIENGSFQINNVSNDQVLYFDYKDFLISNERNDQQAEQKRNKIFQDYHKRIKDFVRKKSASILAQFGSKSETKIHIWDSFISNSWLINEHVSLHIYQQSKEYASEWNIRDFDYVKQLFLKEFEEISFYLNTATKKKKSILNLVVEDFEPPSLLESKLTLELTNWKKNECINEFEGYRKTDAFIKRESWLNQYGTNPLSYINEILKVYGCNNYRLISPNPNVTLDHFDKYNAQINVIDSDRDVVTNFNNLSSGEKVLMALALLVYQHERKGTSSTVILLDEIDATLHPSMIKKLIEVIEEKFVKESNKKVILATHAPTTVAISENIFVVNSGPVQNKVERVSNERALDILTEGFISVSNDEGNLALEYELEYANKPILMVEGITDKILIETAWKKLNSEEKELPFLVYSFFDCYFIQNTFLREDTLINDPSKTFIGILDFDSAVQCWLKVKQSSNYQIETELEHVLKNKKFNAYLTLLPVPELRTSLADITFSESYLSIEHFFDDEVLVGYLKGKSIAGGGSVQVFDDSKKKDFARSTKNFDAAKFSNFQLIFDKIAAIIEK